MKYIFLIFVLVSSLVAASSRQDDVTLKFSKSSEKLTKADGYSKNITLGKWVKNKNLLCDKVVTSKLEKTMMYQNFDYLQVSKLNYNNNEFFTLITEKDNGGFKYPKIQKEWITFKETIILLFTKDEIKEINEYISSPKEKPLIFKKTFHSATMIDDRFKHKGGENSYTNEVIMSQVTTLVKNTEKPINKNQITHYDFPILSTLEDNKHVIRFKVPFLNLTIPSNTIMKDVYSVRIRTNSLEYDYFEVSVEEFKKLFAI